MGRLDRSISAERRVVYYAGMALAIAGLLLFLSVFITAAGAFGDFNGFVARARSFGYRAFGGMALMIVGSILMSVGARGFAGSGILLNPDRTRRDLEPWSRMVGGVVDDALAEVDSDRGGTAAPVKIRCRQCQALNDENSKYCGHCGAAI
jgi:hypothetical protein